MFDKRLMAMCPESRKFIAGNIILQWLELCMNAVMIGMIAYAAEQLYRRELTPSGAAPMLAAVAVTIVIRFFTTRGAVRMSYLASRTVKRRMRGLIYKKLLKLGMGYREKVTTAELVQESVEGVDQLESYFGQYVPQFFYAFLAPLTLFGLFTAAGSLQTALVLLICVPLIPATIMIVQKIAKRILAKYWDQYTRLGSINSIIIMDLLAYGGAAAGIILSTRAFIDGSIGLAQCLFMILLSADFFLPMRRLGSYFHVAMNGMAASDRIFHFLALEEPEEKTEQFPEKGGSFLLKSVSFSYDGEREVLHRINMQIPRNSFVGIVGESGSGKSTIAALLTGRASLQSGSIMVDGTPLSECSRESCMKGITYIGSSSYFFKGTVRDNLLMGDPEASDEKLWEALAECELDDFLRAEGNSGLDTALTENAQNLSGGQKQRLALARALLHDSPVYIFDEATSNIDMESEEVILTRIRALAGSKTVILISHRLMASRDADRIFVMENGKLAESGTHRELMKWGGVYSTLWTTQQKLERFGRDDDSGEKWLTGEIEKISATGEIGKIGDTGRIGNTGKIGDTGRIGNTGKIGNTGMIGTEVARHE